LAQSAIEEKLSGRVLDMGCGYGLVGLLLKKFNPEVTIDGIDVNIKAVECAIASAERLGLEAHYAVKDGREDLGMSYEAILLNPPIRAGKATIFELYRNAYKHLKPQGALIIVIRRQQGSASSLKELQTLFPAVSRIKLHKGYEILKSIKD
jgi:16S rRNA (guanine1207-N2)-methyltransferase